MLEIFSNMEILVVLLLTMLTFFEGFITSIPLVLMCLLTLAAYTKSSRVYIYAFISGCMLDILTGQTLGITSLIFVLFLGIIFLYQRKYEINSHIFILFASFILSLLFCLMFHVSHLFIHVISSVLLAEALFILWNIIFLKENTPTHTS